MAAIWKRGSAIRLATVLPLACCLVSCMSDRESYVKADQKQEQTAGGVGIVLWTVPSPARLGENIVFVELAVGSEKVLSEFHVLLTYKEPSVSPMTTPLRNTDIGIFSSKIYLSKAGEWSLMVTVQSPSRAPIRATFPVMVSDRPPEW